MYRMQLPAESKKIREFIDAKNDERVCLRIVNIRKCVHKLALKSGLCINFKSTTNFTFNLIVPSFLRQGFSKPEKYLRALIGVPRIAQRLAALKVTVDHILLPSHPILRCHLAGCHCPFSIAKAHKCVYLGSRTTAINTNSICSKESSKLSRFVVSLL